MRAFSTMLGSLSGALPVGSRSCSSSLLQSVYLPASYRLTTCASSASSLSRASGFLTESAGAGLVLPACSESPSARAGRLAHTLIKTSTLQNRCIRDDDLLLALSRLWLRRPDY